MADRAGIRAGTDGRDMTGTPLFVVGVGRSGTSLIQSMLASHPQIVSLPETGFLRRRVWNRSWGRRRHSVDTWFSGDPRLQRIDSEKQQRIGITLAGEVSATDLYRAVREAYLPTDKPETCRYLLDKDPRLIEHLPAVFSAFPRAQVVHILRDPRDVLLSKEKAKWSARRPWWLNLLVGLAQLDRMDRRLAQPEIWRVITVRYEDLITNPEPVLRQITASLDLDYDSGMLQFSRAARHLRAGDESAWKENVAGPLLAENRDKWRTAMSPYRLAVCDGLAHRHLRRGGYTLAGWELTGRPLIVWWIRVRAVMAVVALTPVQLLLRVLVDRSASRWH